MDSSSPGPLSRCTSIAAAMMISVNPSAFSNSGCIRSSSGGSKSSNKTKQFCAALESFFVIGTSLNRRQRRQQRGKICSVPFLNPSETGGSLSRRQQRQQKWKRLCFLLFSPVLYPATCLGNPFSL